MTRLKVAFCSFVFLFLSDASFAQTHEFSGDLSLQTRGFYSEGQFGNTEKLNASIAIEPQYVYAWDNDRSAITLKPFVRLDANDPNRTHWDIRQADWVHAFGDFEFRFGIRKVYWGVTESLHLVDIVNQTDFVENFDGEQKLGQPMINLSWSQDFGTFDFFIMTYHRKRTHPGVDGRLRFGLLVSDDPVYEANSGRWAPDFAFRWYHSMGNLDLGVHHFYGTSREPRYVLSGSVLVPYYDRVHQTGIDAQLITGAWLWKLETVSRHWNLGHHVALAGGFEHTFSNIGGSGTDVGILAEYLYDSRGAAATSPFESDLFVGSRIALNDEADLQLLAGMTFDLDSSSKFLNAEFSRLFGNHFKLSIESRAFLSLDASDFLKSFENESYSQIELTYSW